MASKFYIMKCHRAPHIDCLYRRTRGSFARWSKNTWLLLEKDNLSLGLHFTLGLLETFVLVFIIVFIMFLRAPR